MTLQIRPTLTTFAARAINRFRGSVVAANSPHTSNFSLARLAARKSLQTEITSNLARRINGGSIRVSSLYLFEPSVVAGAIKLADIDKVAAILSQAVPGRYPLKFLGVGRVFEKQIWHNFELAMTFRHIQTTRRTYELPCSAIYSDFNLQFFKEVKDAALPWEIWPALISMIANTNSDLAEALLHIDRLHERAQISLRKVCSLPATIETKDYRN
ncbi:MAG: hypothetical protein WC527_08295 [Candidatus Margulisiibacteriota bacterium]